MINIGHPHEYQGQLLAKFKKAAARTSESSPRVFKNSDDFANHVVRACNSGVLLHFTVADALELGARTKQIHRTLRNLKPSQIDETCREILNQHEDIGYFKHTKTPRPE
jgi:intergrase/recombinase